jgi:hypothetical protein
LLSLLVSQPQLRMLLQLLGVGMTFSLGFLDKKAIFIGCAKLNFDYTPENQGFARIGAWQYTRAS